MDKSQKKKAVVSAVAAATAASVLVSGAFTSPADILDDGPDALIQSMDLDMDSQTDSGDGADDGEESEDRGGIKAGVRKALRQIPAPLRACVALPLWLLGTVLVELGSALWGSVLSPVFAAVLSWAAIAVMALLVFLLAAKTVAPDLPIKKILNKGTVLTIFALCFGFGLLDNVLPLFVEGYETFSQWVKAIGSCICTAVPICFFLRRNSRRLRAKQEKTAELSYEEQELAARRLIEELADSVCR